MANLINTPYRLDVIKELANIGLGNASCVLANMIHKQIKVKITHLNFMDRREIVYHIGGNQEIISIFSKIKGDIQGCFVNILSNENSLMHVDALNRNKIGTTIKIDDYGKDVLKEYSTIVAGAYLNSLSKMTNLDITFEVPEFAKDNSKIIFENQYCRNMHKDCPRLFNIHNVLYSEEYDFPLYSDMIILCPPESVEMIMLSAIAKARTRT